MSEQEMEAFKEGRKAVAKRHYLKCVSSSYTSAMPNLNCRNRDAILEKSDLKRWR